MTSFASLEPSVESSRPLEVYSFALLSEVFRYTSSEVAVTVGGNTYDPEAIRRSNILRGPEERTRPLVITVPSDNAFVSRFKAAAPGQRTSVTIIRLQRDEVPAFNTQVLSFKGFLQSIRFINSVKQAEMSVKSLEVAASRTIPRITFQGPCNHQLYDVQCGATPITFVGLCTAVSGNTITVAGANSQPNGFWNGGFVKPSGVNDPRLIINHTGNVLTILQPFNQSPLNANCDIFAGCDHLIDGNCQNRHGRVGEFGGFAWVPKKNPFSTGLD